MCVGLNNYYLPHFSGKETEAGRDDAGCPGSQLTCSRVRPGPRPDSVFAALSTTPSICLSVLCIRVPPRWESGIWVLAQVLLPVSMWFTKAPSPSQAMVHSGITKPIYLRTRNWQTLYLTWKMFGEKKKKRKEKGKKACHATNNQQKAKVVPCIEPLGPWEFPAFRSFGSKLW